jgi:hypothetical protein
VACHGNHPRRHDPGTGRAALMATAYTAEDWASCGCLAIAGATLLAQAGGGLYWLVPSAVAAVFFGLVNAGVLLVEILR